MKNLVGIDIGGTKCAVSLGIIKENGEIEVQINWYILPVIIPGHILCWRNCRKEQLSYLTNIKYQ